MKEKWFWHWLASYQRRRRSGSGVSNQKHWACDLELWEEGASTKENRQVGRKMWNSVVDTIFELLARHPNLSSEREGRHERGDFEAPRPEWKQRGLQQTQLLFGLILAEESREHLEYSFEILRWDFSSVLFHTYPVSREDFRLIKYLMADSTLREWPEERMWSQTWRGKMGEERHKRGMQGKRI